LERRKEFRNMVHKGKTKRGHKKAGGQVSASLGERHQEKPNLPHLDFGTLVCCLSHPIFGILLWQT
jgi:hypothetical protein